ncbi:hypothetical protein Ddye_016196 [Dipteronia dyeriana]|uniref:Transposase n=1 Tax=Dipteronia dyeriana TaxID=168575 RepID=A0AAD9X026_9ROSI|nr:hypothetical protein Ddye_016196 [Dipteronia dyeriana]
MFRDACFQDDCNAEPEVEIRDEGLTLNVEDVETPLYEGCAKYTKLSAIVVLYKHKATHGLSDKGFYEILGILREMFPLDNVLPESLYSAKKLLKVFDLGYQKIHVCINDCCLFRKELKHLEKCPKCGESRWKLNTKTNHIYKGVHAKVLRYFPIILRFRRMSRSVEMTNDLTWHFTHKSQDGKIWHPVESPAWESIDDRWPCFALEPRNMRLGLSTDGFNPFRKLSTKHSCWPIVLVTYNLPLWKCMSQENLILTLLIPRPKQPGNDIDVYLQPLIEDLN